MTEPIDSRYGGLLLNRLDRMLYGVEVGTAVIGGGVIFIVMWVGVAGIFLLEQSTTLG